MCSTQTHYRHMTPSHEMSGISMQASGLQKPTSFFGWVRFVTQIWLYPEKVPATAITKANRAAPEINVLYIKLWASFITSHKKVFSPSHLELRFASYARLTTNTVEFSGSYTSEAMEENRLSFSPRCKGKQKWKQPEIQKSKAKEVTSLVKLSMLY